MRDFSEDVRAFVRHQTDELRMKISSVVSLGRLGATNDDGVGQVGQVSTADFQAADSTNVFQQSGFTSRPLPGSRGVVLKIGDRSISFLFGANENRPAGIEPGETVVYSESGKQKIHLKDTGEVRMSQFADEGEPAAASLVMDSTGFVSINSGGQTGTSVTVNLDSTISLGGDAANLSVAIGEITDANFTALNQSLGVMADAFTATGNTPVIGSALGTALGALIDAVAAIQQPTGSSTSKTAP